MTERDPLLPGVRSSLLGAVPTLECRARRRRTIVRSALAASAAVGLVGGGFLLIREPDEPGRVEVATPPSSTEPPTSTRTAPPPSFDDVPTASGAWSEASTVIGGVDIPLVTNIGDRLFIAHHDPEAGWVQSETWDPTTGTSQQGGTIGSRGFQWSTGPFLGATSSDVVLFGQTPSEECCAGAILAGFGSFVDPPPNDLGEFATVAGDEDSIYLWPAALAFRPSTNSWRAIAPWPLGDRFHPQVVENGSHAIVWGGCTGGPDCRETNTGLRNDGAVYDIADNSWTPLPASPLPPAVHAVSAWTGAEAIFVVTDANGATQAATFDVFEPAWTSVTSPPLSARHFAAGTLAGPGFVVFGGESLGDSSVLSDGAVWTPASDEWLRLPDAPGGRSRHSMAWTGQAVYVSSTGAAPTPLLFDPFVPPPVIAQPREELVLQTVPGECTSPGEFTVSVPDRWSFAFGGGDGVRPCKFLRPGEPVRLPDEATDGFYLPIVVQSSGTIDDEVAQFETEPDTSVTDLPVGNSELSRLARIEQPYERQADEPPGTGALSRVLFLAELTSELGVEIWVFDTGEVPYDVAVQTAEGVARSLRPHDVPPASSCAADDVFVTFRPLADSAEHGQAEVVVTNVGMVPCTLPEELSVQAAFLTGGSPAGMGESTTVDVPSVDPGTARADNQIPAGRSVAIRLTWDLDDGSTTTGPASFLSSLSIPALFSGGLLSQVESGMQPDGLTFQAPVTTDFGGPIGRAMFEPSGTVAYVNPADPTDTLSIYGLGAVRVDMTMQEVADATGQRVVVTSFGEASGGCGYAYLGGVADVTIPIYGPDSSTDPLEARVAGVITGNGYRTSTGIGIGSTEDEVLQAWGANASRNDYGGEYGGPHIVFTPTDTDEADQRAFAFVGETGLVTDFIVGYAHAFRGEGCA